MLKKIQSLLRPHLTEIIGGLTTFVTMSYIIVVNATILAEAGMDEGAVMVATILITFIASIMMGLISNFPIALAPALSITPFLAYSVVLKQGFTFQQAMGAVFISSLFLLIFNMINIRQKIIKSIPHTLRYATTGGIGLFLILIGLQHIGIIGSGNMFITIYLQFSLEMILCLCTIIVIGIFLYFKIKAAYILSLLFFWAIALVFNLVSYQGVLGPIPSITPTLFQLDLSLIDQPIFWSAILSIFLIALVDSGATLMTLCYSLNAIKEEKLPNLQPSFFCDSVGSMFGAMLGAGSITFHLESTSGIQAGARTGKAAIVTAICFFATLFFYPLIKTIPEFASSSVLIVIGFFLFKDIFKISWKDPIETIPSFLLLATLGLTLSIYNGLSIGFISYALLKLCTKKIQKINWIFWILCLVLLLHRIVVGVYS